MAILDALLQRLPADEIPIRNVIVGARWTAVCSRHCGLASTLINEGPHGGHPVRDVGRLHHKSAQELAGWVQSENLLEASIGMAALNSLLEVDEAQAVEINAAEVLADEGKGRNIAIVGHFPFSDRLRSLARNLWVIEKRPYEGDLPEETAREYLPQSDVVAITGTTLINHTLDPLLALCPTTALVMILGPSTPLSPILFDYGIRMLSGAKIMDETAAIQTIQQGAVFPQVQGVRLITMMKPNLGE